MLMKSNGLVIFLSTNRFCHQLDFSTSGALCVALNKAAAGRAYRCFKDRTVTKAYLALVWNTNTVTHMPTTELLPYICLYVALHNIFFLLCVIKRICKEIKLIPNVLLPRYVAG